MKEFNLRQELQTLKDKRRGQAQQHKIDVVLMIVTITSTSDTPLVTTLQA